MQLFDFGHQCFINGQAPSRIDKQHVKKMTLGIVNRCACNVCGLLVGRAGEPLGSSLRGDGFKLFDRSRAVDVARHSEHFFPAFFNQVFCKFGGGGRFTCALQTGHQNDRGGLRGQVDVTYSLAHGGGQFLADNAHQHLPRLQ